MRRVPVKSFASIFLFVQPLSPIVGDARAQEPSDSLGECTVQVTARAMDAGLSAVRVWAYYDRDIGRVRAFHASEESGVRLASPDLLARIRVADGGRAEATGDLEPIAMGPEPRSARIWLSLFDAEPGEYPVTLEGERGRCRGVIRVDG